MFVIAEIRYKQVRFIEVLLYVYIYIHVAECTLTDHIHMQYAHLPFLQLLHSASRLADASPPAGAPAPSLHHFGQQTLPDGPVPPPEPRPECMEGDIQCNNMCKNMKYAEISNIYL